MKKLVLLFVAVMLLIGVTAFQAEAQSEFSSPYGLSSDTVTNTGTAYLTSNKLPKSGSKTTIGVVVTKISGTVAGTITLQGSLDGINFKALTTEETQTALATVTATDASTSYYWRLNGSPFLYYRVSWTGSATMAASFTASALVR